MKYLRSVVFCVVLMAVTAVISVETVCLLQPWNQDVTTAESVPPHTHTGDEVILESDTVVHHKWITPDGRFLGEYETTLYDYNNTTAEVAKNSSFRHEASTIFYCMVTEEKMRGYLRQHEVSEAELDLMAHIFQDNVDQELYLAYTER